MTSDKTRSIFTLNYWLICTSSFLFSSSLYMLIPELPAYLSSIGGAEYKGYIIGLFTLSAGFSRPFSGKLTDTVGRVPVMVIGSLVCVVCGLLYPVLITVSGFLLLRLFHGFSTGFKPTASAAYIADIVPAARWGEAMGIHGIFFNLGLALGPVFGSLIAASYNFNYLFYCSSIFALLSVVILFRVKETHPAKQAFKFSLLKISRKDVFEPRVMPAAIVTFLGYISYGAILTLIPDWSAHLGVTNKGMFYVLFTLSSLGVRFFSGKLADKKGRIYVLRIALFFITISVFLLGFQYIETLFTGAVLYGIGTGLFAPAISAWTADLSPVDKRGRGMATMFIALEVGLGIGALVAGWWFKDNIEKIPAIFFAFAGCTIIGLIYLLRIKEKRISPAAINI